MLPPDVIDRIKRDKEERERPALRLPLYPPREIHQDDPGEDEEKTAGSVIIIDLL